MILPVAQLPVISPSFRHSVANHFFLKEKNWKCLSRFIIDFVGSGYKNAHRHWFGLPRKLCWQNNQKKAFPTVLFCSAISCISSTIVYIFSIYSIDHLSTCSLSDTPRTLQLYRTCYFLASSTQQINLYPWIIFNNGLFCRLSECFQLWRAVKRQPNSVKLSFSTNTK